MQREALLIAYIFNRCHALKHTQYVRRDKGRDVIHRAVFKATINYAKMSNVELLF